MGANRCGLQISGTLRGMAELRSHIANRDALDRWHAGTLPPRVMRFDVRGLLDSLAGQVASFQLGTIWRLSAKKRDKSDYWIPFCRAQWKEQHDDPPRKSYAPANLHRPEPNRLRSDRETLNRGSHGGRRTGEDGEFRLLALRDVTPLLLAAAGTRPTFQGRRSGGPKRVALLLEHTTRGQPTVIRLLALIGAIAAAATVSAQPAFTPAPTFSAPHPAVVRVAVPERDGAAYGSGALVAVNESTGLVVTNWHVVCDAAGPIAVYFPDGFRSPATVLRIDRDWDLAALAIWRPNVQPIAGVERGAPARRAADDRRLRQRLVSRGDRAFDAIRFARRQSAVRDDRAQRPARQGDSGGPILNSRGELAGVLFGTAFGRTTGSYCGRLRWFLGSVDGDFQRISSQALVGPTIASQSAAGGRH